MKLIYSTNKKGFTLLELVVAMSISAIILQMGIANYQRFNRTQTLKNTGLGVKNALKDAQTKAIAAVKPDAVSYPACTVSSTLDYYEMTLSPDCGSGRACIQSQAVCSGTATGPTSIFTLPLNYSFDVVPSDPVRFYPLRGSSNVTGNIDIQGALSTEVWFYRIHIDAGGEIQDCGYQKDSAPTCP